MWHIGVHKVNKSDIYLNNGMKYFILIHCLRHYGYFFLSVCYLVFKYFFYFTFLTGLFYFVLLRSIKNVFSRLIFFALLFLFQVITITTSPLIQLTVSQISRIALFGSPSISHHYGSKVCNTQSTHHPEKYSGSHLIV